MNKLPLLAAFVIPALCHAATVPGDTVTFVNVKETILTQSSTSMVLVVEQNDSSHHSFVWTPPEVDDSGAPLLRWNPDLPFVKNKKRKPSASVGTTYAFHGLYAGAAMVCGDSPDFVKTGWEIGLSQLAGADIPFRAGGTSVRVAAGFGWKIVNVGSRMALTGGQGPLTVEPLPEGATNAKAKITNFHFTFPLMLVQPLGRGNMVLSAGGELHLNTYTRASASYRTAESVTVKHKLRGLEQRFATVDVVAFLGMKGACGLYARWSPMKPWRSGYGPDYQTLSLGAMLGF